MEEIKRGMNKIFNASIVTSVIILVLGIFLFIQPDIIIHMISVVLGTIFLIPGITSLITYIKTKQHSNLIMAVITIIMSLILIVNTQLVASILPFILGIYFVVNGINRLQYALALRKIDNSIAGIILSLLIILSGILFIINPFGGALVITKVIGIFMVVYAILDLTNSIILKKEINVQDTKTSMKDAIIEIKVDDNND